LLVNDVNRRQLTSTGLVGGEMGFDGLLRALMGDRGLSGKAVARKVPCDPAYISRLVNGKQRPSRQVAERLDDLLGAGGRLVGAFYDLSGAERAVETLAGSSVVGHSGSSAEGEYLSALLVRATGSSGSVRQSGPELELVVGGGLLVDVTELVMAVAHESSDRAAEDGGRMVPSGSVEQVRAEVHRLAHSYNLVTPLAFLAEARRVRDVAFSLAERTRRPAQAADLYVNLAQVCGLMSVGSFDLAVWPAAIEQAHAAFVYAELAGHRPLQAWVRGMQALNAYWCGRTGEAVELAGVGLALAPPGTAQARLHCISARAWSHVRAVDQTRAALAAADRDRDLIGEAGHDELHDGIGGEFGWGPARQAMCSASALLWIGDADEAARRATEAILLRPQDQTGSLVDMTARADLACAELARGGLDAADEALSPVWDLVPAHRRHSLVERLHSVAKALARPCYARTAEAVALTERIEAFTADSAPRLLPPGMGGVQIPGVE
jgi:transcriptional regulator with XRE-family HTH domain